MTYKYDLRTPIYLQIMQILCYRIVRGDCKAGEKLPSWVEAGLEFEVNINTIAKTYAVMAAMGLVVTRCGEGTFITEDKNRLRQLQEEMRETMLSEFVNDMEHLGYCLDDIEKYFIDYIEQVKGNRQRRIKDEAHVSRRDFPPVQE